MSNMLIVDLRSRQKEFGLLEAVGATQRQLRRMLFWEMGTILGVTGLLSLLVGAVASTIVCVRIDALHHCINVVLPWPFLLAFFALLFVIGGVTIAVAWQQLRRRSVLAAVRGE